ncbi:hypothetical protein TD95_003037 [Thielaviopsis punctulata]|uniref:AMP-dependent synthetase/ligase domain-containing protein n=1 Tax=Thielaviopsis punctulata TaxID=72032 RepID=A0A0F4ZDX4_9PEZI|nr:hypothetical protein TD95_003037 [Thielaviopsis punctulata]
MTSLAHRPLTAPAPRNIFNFIFEQPFSRESSFCPPSQAVPAFPMDRPVIVDNQTDRPLTFGQVKQDALRIAANFEALGLDFSSVITLPPTPTCAAPQVAPIVLVQLPNCQPMVSIIMGVFASGLTATLASPALTADELSWILQNAFPRVIITSTACWPAMKAALAKQQQKEYFAHVKVFTVDVPGDQYPLPSSCAAPAPASDWRALLKPCEKPMRFREALYPPDAWKQRTAVVLWSSGTSGRSKGVLLSHSSLTFCTASLWYDSDYYKGQQQRWLGYVPFYHVFGFVTILLLGLATGTTVYTMSSFNLKAVLDAVRDRKITYFHMAPPVAVMLDKAPIVAAYAKRDASGKNAFSSVIAGLTGGAPLGHDIVVQVYNKLGFRIKSGYGMSEAGNVAAQPGLTEADMHFQSNDTGRPHAGVQIKISGATPDTLAPINTPGEILVRSPCLMTAYLPAGGLAPGSTGPFDMSATMEALTPDGWLRTGDVGTLDAGGALRITDRIKEMIKVRAYQVAPAELEALIGADDEVADVGVVGVHDKEEASEWPRAFVVAQNAKLDENGQDKLAQHIKQLVEKKTAKYKWLIGGIVFVEQIPKSPSGKILRRMMRDGKVQGRHVQLYEKKKRGSKL